MLNIRLSDSLSQALAKEAQQRNMSRSQVARDALSFYLQARKRHRYIGRLKQAAARLDAVEAEEFAQESLSAGNELTESMSDGATGDQSDHRWWR